MCGWVRLPGPAPGVFLCACACEVGSVSHCPDLPAGCMGTASALMYGLYCFHRGQSQRSQLMMRTRIAAQGFTVVAILLGLASSAMKARS